MIPLFLSLKVKRISGRSFRLWLPLILVWLILLPVVLLLLPFVFIALLIVGSKPFQALKIFYEIFCALRGIDIEVIDSESAFVLSIY